MSDDHDTDDRTVRQGLRLAGAELEGDPDTLVDVVDYRGDVTVTRAGSSETVSGYVFDATAAPAIRLLPADGGPAVTIPLADVALLEVTGKDTAAGKSFERWVNRYLEKKRAGEPANIDEG